jgi:hypothetical protein
MGVGLHRSMPSGAPTEPVDGASELCVESAAVAVLPFDHLLGIGLALGPLAFALAFAVPFLGVTLPSAPILAVALGGPAYVAWRVLCARPECATVRAAGGGEVSIERSGKRSVFARSRLLARLPGGSGVLIASHWSLIAIGVADRAAGLALASALAHAPRLVATALTGMPLFMAKRWHRTLDRHPWVGAIACTALLSPPALIGLAIDPALYGVGLLVAPIFGFATAVAIDLLPPKVFVGRDGVLVTSFSRREFVAYERVKRAQSKSSSAVVVLFDGASIELPMGSRRGSSLRDVWASSPHGCRVRRDVLVAQITAALARYREAASALLGAERALARGSRSIAEWRDAMSRTKAYRETHLGSEELLAVVENPRAGIDQRLGAALALGALPDQPGAFDRRERIREAIASSANPRVRVALECAVAGALDDATYDAALKAEAAKPVARALRRARA